MVSGTYFRRLMETRTKSSGRTLRQVALALVVGVPGTLMLLFLCLLLAAVFLGHAGGVTRGLVLFLALGLPVSAFCTLLGFDRLRDWLYILSFPVWSCAVGAIAPLLPLEDRASRASLSALLAMGPVLISHYLIYRYYLRCRESRAAAVGKERTEKGP
jgi:hypothetical protein